MADVMDMSQGKAGLGIPMVATHARTISDASSPKFVLRRIEDQASMEYSNASISALDSNLVKENGHIPEQELDNHHTTDTNPYIDDDNSVVEYSEASGSDPLNSDVEMDAYQSPRGLIEDEASMPVGEDRSHLRRVAFKAKSEGMISSAKEAMAPFSPQSPEAPMGSLDGVVSRDSQYFEMEFARREAENQVEQMKLQVKSKNSQLEQVQMVLMSYEEEIMNLRKNGLGTVVEGENENNGEDNPQKEEKPVEHEVALKIAEDLSKKIVSLQTNVQELEEDMVRVKLENAQLRETNEFLRNAVQKCTKRDQARGIRNPFARQG